MNSFKDLMLRMRLVFISLVLVLHMIPSLSISIKSNNNIPNIISKRKIQLKPIVINCFLNDIVRISAPIISNKDQYYLSKPNGETSKLDLLPIDRKINKTSNYFGNTLTATFIENSNTILQQSDNFDVFTVRKLNDKMSYLEKNEFLIGPLLEEDNGNWLLSIFTKDKDGELIELFQTLTIAITEYTVLEPRWPKLHVGKTLSLSFAYPMPSIEACEIIAPRSTFDRFYTRSAINFNKCGFLIPNITKDDDGFWKIIGVGRIAYKGVIKLDVIDDDSIRWDSIYR